MQTAFLTFTASFSVSSSLKFLAYQADLCFSAEHLHVFALRFRALLYESTLALANHPEEGPHIFCRSHVVHAVEIFLCTSSESVTSDPNATVVVKFLVFFGEY
jgi:hypothetical protein